MTRHPDLFVALLAPFAQHEVKVRSQAGRQFHYVTARTVMNRLDEVLGPENWCDDYLPGEHSVLCRLTIRLPDGATLTKCDAGGYAGMTDQGDDDKSGYSDAFKRAAVKFGIGRYLYQDGIPRFAPDSVPAPGRAAQPAPMTPQTPRETWAAYVARVVRQANDDWRNEVSIALQRPCTEDLIKHQDQIMNEVCTRACARGLIDQGAILGPHGTRNAKKARAAVADLFRRRPNSTRKTVEVYLIEKRIERRAELGLPDSDAALAPALPREPGCDDDR